MDFTQGAVMLALAIILWILSVAALATTDIHPSTGAVPDCTTKPHTAPALQTEAHDDATPLNTQYVSYTALLAIMALVNRQRRLFSTALLVCLFQGFATGVDALQVRCLECGLFI